MTETTSHKGSSRDNMPPTEHSSSEAADSDINSPYGLTGYDKSWAAFYPVLESQGYLLRPRYKPGWIGSWVGTSKRPEDCEDSIGLSTWSSVLDAVRKSDGAQVAIKIWTGSEVCAPEVPVLEQFSSGSLASDPRNHCVPLLDSIPLEGFNGAKLLVEPLLRDWRDPPFRMVVEGLAFIRQLIEGLAFMHEHNVAHRDIHVRNILMDAAELYPDGFHGAFNFNSTHRASEKAVRKLSRIQAPPKYYFVDFGLSTMFPTFEERRLVTFFEGVHKDLPELRSDRSAPYDPFKADVHALGWMLSAYFVSYRTGLEFMYPLFAWMMEDNPDQRPTAAECLSTFDVLTRKLSRRQVLARLGWFRSGMTWWQWAGDVMAYLKLLWTAGMSELRGSSSYNHSNWQISN